MMGHAGPQGVCRVVIVRVCNRSGFLVATNIKIRQGVGYESTQCYRYYELINRFYDLEKSLMKGLNMKIIFTILMFFCLSQNAFSQALLSNNEVRSEIMKYINVQEVPVQMDKLTTLQSVEVFGVRGIQYNYKLGLTISDLGGEIGLKTIKKNLFSQNLNSYCENPALIWYKKNVVEMVWKYFDKNNSDLLTIRVDSNDCN